MAIVSIAVGLTRTRTSGEDVEVGQVRWRSPDLPSRMLFVEVVAQLYERVELPSFPSTAWAELENDVETSRVEIQEVVGEPEAIGAALWAWVVMASQSLE